jgi:hypothetical protein
VATFESGIGSPQVLNSIFKKYIMVPFIQPFVLMKEKLQLDLMISQ